MAHTSTGEDGDIGTLTVAELAEFYCITVGALIEKLGPSPDPAHGGGRDLCDRCVRDEAKFQAPHSNRGRSATSPGDGKRPIALLEALGPPPLDPVPAAIEMCESSAGYYRYHLRRPDCPVALCNEWVMGTRAPLEAWGFVGHLNEHYCSTCRAKAGAP